jgi:hypothetical protein
MRLSQLGQAITSFAQMASENAHGCAQNADNGFGYDFLQQTHKYGNKLDYVVRVTGDEINYLLCEC